MVWVCGDSWRGPAGAAGKERLHWDGAAQQESGNWCHWHCQWGCVTSVLLLEGSTGDETAEGPDGSVASSFAAATAKRMAVLQAWGCCLHMVLLPVPSNAREHRNSAAKVAQEEQ